MTNFYQLLLHRKTTTTVTRLISGEYNLLRQLSTAAQPQRRSIRKESLFKKLHDLGSFKKGVKVGEVLHEVINRGQNVPKSVLIDCLKDLRKHGRYQHCLEILDWLEKGRYDYSSTEHALRIGIVYKLKGIDEVEKYFDRIPPDARGFNIYGALFNCYCTELETDKALALLRRMEEMNFEFNVLVYNNLIGLYVKLRQPEKVPALVEEMKGTNVPLNSYTYSLWMQSYQLLNDLEGLEQVFQEAQEQDTVKNDWVIYSTCAKALIEVGQIGKAISVLKQLEDVLDSSEKPERNAYHHLISLSASTGKLELVTQAWNKLKSSFENCSNLSYLTMLQALSNLDDIDGLKAYLKEWESSYKYYDDRIPVVLISAYLRHDMLEDAEHLLKNVTEKVGEAVSAAHVVFMNYFFEKHQLDSSLKHMEAAISSTRKWKPNLEKLEPFFQHFKETKDVNGAEELCGLLKRAQSLDGRAYLWLLQTYADAEKTAPELRLKMEDDGIDLSPEHEVLLERVCPN